MLLWISAWLAIGVALLIGQVRLGAGTGLVAAYGLQMFVLHWLAAVIYVLPWFSNLNPDVVFAGLAQSTYAMAGLTVGVVGVSWLTTSNRVAMGAAQGAAADARALRLYTIVGAGAYVVLTPLLGNVATLSAIVSSASGCVVMALAIVCWNTAHGPRPGRLWWWLALVSFLPFITIAVQGFMGYGLAAAAIVFAFVSSFYRPAWKTVALGLVGAYLGLSLYVTYMRDRNEIREVVWGGESATVRLSRLQATFLNAEAFDIYNVDHLQRIDSRLNQNYLVGAAVMNLDVRPELFADGETIWEAIVAPIPRALWPGKPVSGGSGNLVSRFTGQQFAEGTSVGIGQVMELYINFGHRGVFFGFVLIGSILCYVDRRAAEHRNRGDWPRFALWFLPGLAMLQLGGSLVEVTSSASAAIAVASLLKRFGPRQAAGREVRVNPRPTLRPLPRPVRSRL